MKKVIYYLDIVLLFVLFLVPALLLTFIHPLRSYAASGWSTVEVDGKRCWFDNEMPEIIANGDYYFYCNADSYFADSGSKTPCEFWGLHFSSDTRFTIDEDSGIYTIMLSDTTSFYYRYTTYSNQSGSTIISGFKYDTVNNIFWYLRDGRYIKCGENVIFNLNTNFWESDSGSLDVSFPLPLSGTIGETMTYHDDVTDSDFEIQPFQFDCIIKNSTRQNYQVAWMIEEDNSVDFHFNWNSESNALSGINGLGFNGSPAWVHLMNQWYCGINSGETGGILSNNSLYDFLYSNSDIDDNFFQSVYGPCSWSLVPSGSTSTLHACIKNMNLTSGKVYTCKVYAIPTTGRYVTNISNAVQSLAHVSDSNIYNIALDFDTVQCVYSSTFTLEEGYSTPYVEGWNGAGIISYDPNGNTQELFNSSLASQKTNGAIDMNYKIDKNSPNRNPYSYSYHGSTPSYDSSSYSSFLSFLLGFVRSFPTIAGLFTFGLSAILIIGIIKAVK